MFKFNTKQLHSHVRTEEGCMITSPGFDPQVESGGLGLFCDVFIFSPCAVVLLHFQVLRFQPPTPPKKGTCGKQDFPGLVKLVGESLRNE